MSAQFVRWIPCILYCDWRVVTLQLTGCFSLVAFRQTWSSLQPNSSSSVLDDKNIPIPYSLLGICRRLVSHGRIAT